MGWNVLRPSRPPARIGSHCAQPAETFRISACKLIGQTIPGVPDEHKTLRETAWVQLLASRLEAPTIRVVRGDRGVVGVEPGGASVRRL
jgi:hypothetical protein